MLRDGITNSEIKKIFRPFKTNKRKERVLIALQNSCKSSIIRMYRYRCKFLPVRYN